MRVRWIARRRSSRARCSRRPPRSPSAARAARPRSWRRAPRAARRPPRNLSPSRSPTRRRSPTTGAATCSGGWGRRSASPSRCSCSPPASRRACARAPSASGGTGSSPSPCTPCSTARSTGSRRGRSRFYGGYLRPHAYGLSNQTLGKWLRDGSIDLGVSTLVGVVLAAGLYAWIRRAPRRWWLGATACLIPFLLLVFLIEPLWIAPLYNDFGPMKDEALEAKILGLAERAGIEGSRVFEVAKSVGHERGERVRHRLPREQAHRAVGHAARRGSRSPRCCP